MLGLTSKNGETLRTLVGGVCRLGTLCGVFAMLMLTMGCPVMPPCESDADCDDGMVCTADTCGADGVCVFTEIEGCCTEDAECDDGDFCNGTETCGADNTCVAGMNPCPDDGQFCNGMESCNEDTDACVSSGNPCDPATEDCDEVNDEGDFVCVSAADCDDADECTDDACVDGVCENTAVNCDDGEFCTGVETCDPATGCVAGTDPCAADETCDEANDQCVMVTTCADDTECDDGQFCNGAETCDTATSQCIAGTDPCAADETCDEPNDTCVFAGTARNVRLTLGTDIETGTSGNDTFDASLEVSGGNLFQTLNNADDLDGLGGTDTITVQFRGGGTTTPAGLNGIEIFNLEITDANNTTLNMLNADSATTINNNNSGADLTVMNISAFSSTVGMTNTTQNTTVTVNSSVLSGGADEVTLNVSGVTVAAGEPVVIIQPSTAGSGYETINLVSSGSVANNLDDLQDGNGNSFATLNVSGSQNIKIDDALNATVTTVNGSTASGVIDVLLGVNNATVTGGSGDDILRFGGNFDANDTVDGGADSGSSDILESTDEDFTGTTTTQTNVSNIETIRTTDALSGNLNVVHFGAQNATVAGKDGTARTITIPDGGTVEFTADGGANATTIALSGSDTTSNTFNLKLNGTATADMAGDLTASSFETLNLECTGTADGGSNNLQAITLNNTAAAESIIVTGAISLDIDGAITADSVDASAFTGGFDNVGAAAAGAIAITSGSGTDSLRGSAGADILDAGAGNDRLQGDAGSDLLTGGTGNDTFDQDNIAQADTDTLTDFEAGTSTSSNDIFIWDISSIEAFAAVTDLVDTNANSAVAGDNTFVQLGSDGQTVTNADIVGLIGDYTNAANALANQASWTIVFGAALADNDAFLVAYTSGSNVRIAVAVANGASANSDNVDTLIDIAILQNVTLSNLNSGDFNSEL